MGMKGGGLGDEWFVSRYFSLSSLHHQSLFSLLFLGPFGFFFVCPSLVPVLIYCHSSAAFPVLLKDRP